MTNGGKLRAARRAASAAQAQRKVYRDWPSGRPIKDDDLVLRSIRHLKNSNQAFYDRHGKTPQQHYEMTKAAVSADDRKRAVAAEEHGTGMSKRARQRRRAREAGQ